MELVQFFDGHAWYLVLLPKNWTWELLDNLMGMKGYDTSNWKVVCHIALFDGDLRGEPGHVYPQGW